MNNYGLPYMGSKNKIAEEIVNLLPKADNLYDLFCGGCAITHCAMLKNKYKTYYINDIQPKQAQFFIDCIKGKYKNETRWVSREQFFKEKDTDPFIATCWSFGNKGDTYLYSKENEVFKKALHYAICFNDYSLLKELNIDTPDFSYIDDIQVRRLTFTKWLKSNISNKIRIQHLESLSRLQHIKRLDRMNSICNNYSGILIASEKSYNDIYILPNSVIYCDIPYENTANYISTKNNKFDYNKFYEWAVNQTELVVISSYEIKDNRFICVYEIEKLCTLSKESNSTFKIERLYIPLNQLPLWKKYNKDFKQLTLFE